MGHHAMDAEPMRLGGESCLNCPRCDLTITARIPWLATRYCPRCLARHRTIVEMFATALPTDKLYAQGSAPQAQAQP